MKKLFQEPKQELILLDAKDIICTSGCTKVPGAENPDELVELDNNG